MFHTMTPQIRFEPATFLLLDNSTNRSTNMQNSPEVSEQTVTPSFSLSRDVSVQVLRMSILNLSFAACGFAGIYHLGAVGALLRHGDKLLGSIRACAGASAGALVAAVLITAPDKLEVRTTVFRSIRGQNRQLSRSSPHYQCWMLLTE